ncbi:MAG: thiamine phosphate synthase [Gammaproteobacteria bacterium]|nr:thiamine phosphate synthase [Gammaproteobacteria bacterium]
MEQLSGLYVITDEKLIAPDQFTQTVEQALQGGARIVQYRDKSQDQAKRHQQAQALKQLCEDYNTVLIINDDIELAIKVDAHGVHIGMHDTPLENARRQLQNKIIGVSCYNDFELAAQAQQQGADYIAFGSFFSSSIKPEANKADVELLIKAREELQLPVCAIGGITSDNAAQLIDAGADMLAVITDVFGCDNTKIASEKISRLFSQQ